MHHIAFMVHPPSQAQDACLILNNNKKYIQNLLGATSTPEYSYDLQMKLINLLKSTMKFNNKI